MAKQKKFETLFIEPTHRASAIALTLNERYVSLSNGAMEALNNPEYISFAALPQAPNDVAIFACKKADPGSFMVFDKSKNKAKKLIRPKVAATLAEILHIDLSKGTYRITGELDAKENCLLFDSKNQKKVR